MFVIIGAILGAAGGGLIAWRRKGRSADILLYAFVYGMIFAIAGLFLTLFVHRASV